MQYLFNEDVISLYINENVVDGFEGLLGNSQVEKFVYSACFATVADKLMSIKDKDKKNQAKARLLHLKNSSTLISSLGSDFEDADVESAMSKAVIMAAKRKGSKLVIVTDDAEILKAYSNSMTIKDAIAACAVSKSIEPIAFCDLKAQLIHIQSEIEQAVNEVIESTSFINGVQIKQLEDELSVFTGSKEVMCCSSGTDAILLALMGLGIKPGDEVLVPDFTFFATAEVVALLGAVPVFCDINPATYCIDVEDIAEKVSEKCVGIIAVSLFGQIPPMRELMNLAETHGLWLIEDGAQSFGAEYYGQKSCSIAHASTTSFFPAKPLGCYGDGGAVFTDDEKLAGRIRVLLNHGQTKRYVHEEIGVNGRMDTIQAAILLVKMKHFGWEIEARNKIAEYYTLQLRDVVETPILAKGNKSVWAQYSIQCENREKFREEMEKRHIPTAIHYPIPLHKQGALKKWHKGLEIPESERISKRIVSLPMHPYLKQAQLDYIIESIKGICG